MTTQPLNELLNKCAPDKFEFNDDHVGAFKKFIDDDCFSPVLDLPKMYLQYFVDNSKSEYVLGCTLIQAHADADHKPIRNWPKYFKILKQILYLSS